ncbi:sugar ABC transporter permease [Sporanaerobium hydrogeniformans]|uniref:Sugar ABC transporter permease n=1 Tax=Sporanaerobium hydrogeniformans TaxID=3072179 RepID=A0AC61DH93_9FIRM|nr:sugar ABC transporter permease [Sporanaerobium hydrogeniformans]PHV71976.1 sugar ABC transporter permease [Sporanaerobium hydrogeniformans]
MNSLKKDSLRKWPYLFLAPYFLFYFSFFIYPTIYSCIISLTDWDSLSGVANRKFIGLINYIKLFMSDKLFYKSLGNTFLFMFIYIPILIFGGLLLAVLLYRLNKTSRLFQTINVLPYITTPVAIGIIFSFLFDWSTGILNTILTQAGILEEGINWLGSGATARLVVIILIVWKNMGYYLLIYLAGLSTIPEEISEAAMVDGANKVQVFFKITIPYLKPIIVFLILTSIISGFQLFDEPYLLFSNINSSVGGPERSCMTSMIYFFDQTFRSSTKLGYGAAISYGLFLVVLVVSLIVSRIINRKEEES